MFQSSPLSQEGRYLTVLSLALFISCFNPRPSRKRGATMPLVNVVCIFMFQSSPLSQEGRYLSPLNFPIIQKLFQSSPLSQEGRYLVWRF